MKNFPEVYPAEQDPAPRDETLPGFINIYLYRFQLKAGMTTGWLVLKRHFVESRSVKNPDITANLV